MKTKKTLIVGILAAMLLALPAFAQQQQRPARQRPAADATAQEVQPRQQERPFTPEERALIRQYLRERIEQRRRDAQPRQRQDARRQQEDQARRPYAAGRAEQRPDAFARRGPAQQREHRFGPRGYADERFGRQGQPRWAPPMHRQDRWGRFGTDRGRMQPHGRGYAHGQRFDRSGRRAGDRPGMQRRFARPQSEQWRQPGVRQQRPDLRGWQPYRDRPFVEPRGFVEYPRRMDRPRGDDRPSFRRQWTPEQQQRRGDQRAEPNEDRPAEREPAERPRSRRNREMLNNN